MPFRVMSESDRLVIIGQTGGGKTISGLWQLSLQPVDQFTWIIFDWKRDEQIAMIPYLREWSIYDEPPPSGGGLYKVTPLAGEEDATNDFLHRVWEQENLGLYLDEGMMLKGSRAFRNIMIQGRSKHIPCITLTQLPVDLPRPVFTEATFVQVFYVLDKRYRKIVSEFTPLTDENIDSLRRYYSWYYDVPNRSKTLLRPSPPLETTLKQFEIMLRPPDDVNSNVSVPVQATYYRRPL
jgi:hypothetical protein